MNSAAHDLRHHLRVGLIGAFLFALLFAVFWTTAALGALPEGQAALTRAFGPNPGAIALISGLFWSAVFGEMILFVLSIVYGLARGGARRR